MKKYVPIILACLCILMFLWIIVANEQHLKKSEAIYIKLQPVDPRSLIQGDYMQLNYELYLPELANAEADFEVIQGKAHVLAYVELDAMRRVKATTFEPQQNHQLQKLILKNPHNHSSALYPSTQSFLFAEGLGECYEKAQYAEFKVNREGKAILAGLKGEDLKDLGCEQRKGWWQGSVPILVNKA